MMSNSFLKSILLAFLVFSLFSCDIFETADKSTPSDSQYIRPILLNGKWGFISSNGTIRIVPRFDEALPPTEGSTLAAVRIGTLWGFVDSRTNDLVIEPTFSQVGVFTESGLAAFRNEQGKWGFINEAGAVAIEPTYDFVRRFSGGLAAVRIESLWGYINANAELVIPISLNSAANFSEEYAAVEDNEGWGFINKSGVISVRPRFTVQFLGDYNNGLAPVQTNEGWGYLNKEGALEIPILYEEVSNFSENRARVTINNYVGFIDTDGKILITAQFDDALDFSDGFAAVEIGNSWYFIKQAKGELLLTPSFSEVQPFFNGLAMVAIGNDNNRRIGYINKEGEYVWFPAN